MTPNFFVVGATKGGTSSLDSWLRSHPDVATPKRKELHFFCACPPRLREVETLDEYLSSFPAGKAVGESSPCYLYYPDTPRQLADLSNPKIIVSLRDPAERFWSQYLMNEFYRPSGRTGHEILDDNLRSGRTNAVDDLFGVGLYGTQLGRYRNVFEDNILVLFLEEMAAAPQVAIHEVLRFLDLEVMDLDTSTKDNQHVEPRGPVSGAILHNRRLRTVANSMLPAGARRVLKTRVLGDPDAKPKLPDDLRARLQDLYREDSIELEAVLGRPLPWSWHH